MPLRTGRTGTPAAGSGRRVQAVFWSVYAAAYDAIWDSPLTRSLAGAAETQTSGASFIVDLGCGTGLMTRNCDALVLGVDASAAMLRRALSKGRIDQGVQGRVDSTGLPSATADAVLMCNVLHLHPDPRIVLEEAARLCRPDGTVFICWPLDGLDTASVYRSDRQLGRRFAAARTAHFLRGIIGIAAALTGMRRYPGAAVEDAVFGASGFEVVDDLLLADCQRVVVLRKQSTPALVARGSYQT